MMDQKRLLFRIYKLLARRARTKKEISDWLLKNNASEKDQKEIFSKLEKLKLLDDLSFAQSFIRTRMLLKPRSIRVLRLELAQKGVSKNIIEQALSENEINEEKIAEDLVGKNIWRWKKFDASVRKQKVKEFLLRKGFSNSSVKNIKY